MGDVSIMVIGLYLAAAGIVSSCSLGQHIYWLLLFLSGPELIGLLGDMRSPAPPAFAGLKWPVLDRFGLPACVDVRLLAAEPVPPALPSAVAEWFLRVGPWRV